MTWISEETLPFTPNVNISFSQLQDNEVYFHDRGTNFWKYNLSTKVYTQLADRHADLASNICLPLHYRTATGKIYTCARNRAIFIYDIASNTWSKSSTTPTTYGTFRIYAICFQDDDTIWAWVEKSTDIETKCFKYVPSTDTWTAYPGYWAHPWPEVYMFEATFWNGMPHTAPVSGGSFSFLRYNIGGDSYNRPFASTSYQMMYAVSADPWKLWFYDKSGSEYGYYNLDDSGIYADQFSTVPGLTKAYHAAFRDYATGKAAIADVVPYPDALMSEFFTPSDPIHPYVEIAGLDVTDYILAIHTERGEDAELAEATAGVCQLTCDNRNGDFSPENVGGAFYPDLRIGAIVKVYDKAIGGAPGNISRQIAASTDDCDRSKGPANEWNLTVGQVQAGYQSSDYRQKGAGLRFTNITIPKGAIIDQAYLTLRSRLNKSAGPCNTRISAEKVDNAPTFADDRWAFDDRYANNTATVDWDNIPAWTTGEDYNSPDIKTVIQAIIDREGWASGQAIVIFWEDFEYRTTVLEARRAAHSFDTDPDNAPKLVIEYQIPIPINYDLFKGRIDNIDPLAEKGNPYAYINALDGMDDMKGTKISTVLRTNTDIGTLAGDVLDAVAWPAGDRDLDAGSDVLQLGWFHKNDGLGSMHVLESVENGRFFISPTGIATFHNRHHRLTGAGLVSQYDFGEKSIELDYEYNKRLVKNVINLRGRRYYAGAGATLFSGYDLATIESDLVWSAHAGDAGAPYIPQQRSLTLWADMNAPLADYDTLVKGTHWNANTEPDKSGVDVSDDITLVQTQYGQSVKMVFTNGGTVGAYLVAPDSPPLGAPSGRTALVYGTLYGEEVMAITDEDGASQTAYGIRSLDLDLPFKSNPNDIVSYAQYLKRKYKDAVPRAVSVKIAHRTDWPDTAIKIQCLTREIGDRITLASSRLGFDRDFYINKVVQDYAFNEGGFVAETTFYVERAAGTVEEVFWILGEVGFSELGETTYLGF